MVILFCLSSQPEAYPNRMQYNWLHHRFQCLLPFLFQIYRCLKTRFDLCSWSGMALSLRLFQYGLLHFSIGCWVINIYNRYLAYCWPCASSMTHKQWWLRICHCWVWVKTSTKQFPCYYDHILVRRFLTQIIERVAFVFLFLKSPNLLLQTASFLLFLYARIPYLRGFVFYLFTQ